MRSLQGTEARQRHAAQLGVGYDCRGDGRLRFGVGMHGSAAVRQHPDVNADDDCNAAHVQVDQVDTLEVREQKSWLQNRESAF